MPLAAPVTSAARFVEGAGMCLVSYNPRMRSAFAWKIFSMTASG